MIGPYTMKTGDIIYLWNGKVGVNAQTLPFPFALNSSTQARLLGRIAKRSILTHYTERKDFPSPDKCSDVWRNQTFVGHA